MKRILPLIVLVLFGCSRKSSESDAKSKTEIKSANTDSIDNLPNLESEVENINSKTEEKTLTSETSKIALDFYQWYGDVIKSGKKDDFQPKFVADKNGMLIVDYSKYVANLKRFHFSDELINKEIEGFNKCSENLKGIKFSDRNNQLSDLDDYEERGCDFFNFYRWTMDMETYDGARIIEEELKGDSSVVKVQPFNFSEKTKQRSDWEKTAKVTLNKLNGAWEISKIEI